MFKTTQATQMMLVGLMAAAPLFGQGHSATAFAQASARIVSQSAYARTGGYDPGTEISLQGEVERAADGSVSLHMPYGNVLVELGKAGQHLAFKTGERLQVVVSKVMRGTSQLLLAREVKTETRVVELRDADGMPMEVATQG